MQKQTKKETLLTSQQLREQSQTNNFKTLRECLDKAIEVIASQQTSMCIQHSIIASQQRTLYAQSLMMSDAGINKRVGNGHVIALNTFKSIQS